MIIYTSGTTAAQECAARPRRVTIEAPGYGQCFDVQSTDTVFGHRYGLVMDHG
jgi:hypothetical protein